MLESTTSVVDGGEVLGVGSLAFDLKFRRGAEEDVLRLFPEY